MTDNVTIPAAAGARLKTIVERVERLEEDKTAVQEDIKEVFNEAKGEGFDVKILRKIIRLRKKTKVAREEEETLTELYLSALGES